MGANMINAKVKIVISLVGFCFSESLPILTISFWVTLLVFRLRLVPNQVFSVAVERLYKVVKL